MENKKECTDKEWQHCRVEKMGCNGCYYDKSDSIKNAIFRMICKNDVCIMNHRICNKYKRVIRNTKYFILQS